MKNSFPQRTCIGCRNKFNQSDLLRISLWNDKLTLDKTGKTNGRGVYLCKNNECLEAAIKKKAFNRGFKRNLSKDDMDTLERDIKSDINDKEGVTHKDGKDSEIQGKSSITNSNAKNSDKVYKYLGFAARARKLSVGATATEQAIKKSKAKLVIIGKEVGENSKAKLRPLCEKNNLKLIIYGSCEALSKATGREDKGIFAVEDENLAKAIIETIEKEKEEY